LRSRHNQRYWQNGPYVGIGAGAFGTLGGVRASNVLQPAKYIEAVRRGELPRALVEPIERDTAMGETMMLGLRLLIDGVSARDFAARHGVGLRARHAEAIERYVGLGLLEWHADERLRLTGAGVLLANEVCAGFL
jgi:oxygen-independent coproporphyrinogen-3 oxidase